jgi:copper(I)-binding protein
MSMGSMRRTLFLILAWLSVPPAFAAGEVIVDKAWMRESVPGQTDVSVQLNLYVIADAKLLGVGSPLAAGGEIRRVMRRGGKLQQHALKDLRLTGRSNTTFGERGLYLVLTGLRQPLNVGDRVPVALQLRQGGKVRRIDIEVEVRRLELSYRHYNDPAVMDHQ